MSLVNTATLTRLADKEIEAQVADFGALPIDIRESLIEQQARARKDVVDAAAKEIVQVLTIKDQHLTLNAQAIASLKAKIAEHEKKMAAIQRAGDYGLETQNFLPLVVELGLALPSVNKPDMLKVPKDWVKAEAGAANTATNTGSEENVG